MNYKVTNSQRFFVFLTDFIIIRIISTLILQGVLLFTGDLKTKYNEAYDAYINVLSDYMNNLASSNDIITSLGDFMKYLLILQLINIVIAIILCFLYFVVMAHFTKFQTFGRLLLKAKVVDNNGNEPTFSRLMLREMVGTCLSYMILGSILPTILVSLILCFVSKRSLVDIISNTNMITPVNSNRYQYNNTYNQNNNYYNSQNNNTFDNDTNNSNDTYNSNDTNNSNNSNDNKDESNNDSNDDYVVF